MPTAFERALAHTLGVEGGFSDDPADSGGQTRFGVTEQTARAFGYMGDMRDLPRSVAVAIFKENYWDLLSLGRVSELSVPVSLEMFDTAVNTKHGFAAKALQRLLNVFNREGKDYGDVEVDGIIGRNTLTSLEAFLGRRGVEGEQVLVEALNSLQGSYYVELAERRPKDERFVYGWFLNRVLKRAA